MTTLTNAKFLEFCKTPGDFKITNRVQLDNPGPSYKISLRWMPVAGFWTLDLMAPTGPIVLGAWVRDRTDCLLGISTPGRPSGAIFSYDPAGSEPSYDAETRQDSYITGGAGLWYVPGGINPADFSKYRIDVILEE